MSLKDAPQPSSSQHAGMSCSRRYMCLPNNCSLYRETLPRFITKYGSTLYIGMDEVFQHHAHTFEKFHLNFHFQCDQFCCCRTVTMGNIHVHLKYGKNCITNKGDITKSSFSQFFCLLLLLLFSLQPCISKTVNSSNLKLCTQVGFHDGSCSHMLNFSYIV